MPKVKKLSSIQNVCVIIPAHNEAQVIGDVISSITATMKQTQYNFSIVVVNDGSKDDTGIQAKKSGSVVINHILNSGAGGATSTGLRYAVINEFDVAVTMDADGQHDPEDVRACLDYAVKHKIDLLIGSRLIDKKGMSKVKVLGNKGLTFITWLLFGVNVTDSQSGLRVFSKKALGTLEWKSTGYDFCSEMIWRAKQAGLSLKEYPIKAIYTEYSTSKGQNNWNGINIVKSLVHRRFVELFE